MTQKHATMIRNYKRSSATELSHVYGRCSAAKIQALNYCKRKMVEMNGFAGKICTHNAQIFTYGFLFIRDGKTWMYYITPNYNYEIDTEGLCD